MPRVPSVTGQEALGLGLRQESCPLGKEGSASAESKARLERAIAAPFTPEEAGCRRPGCPGFRDAVMWARAPGQHPRRRVATSAGARVWAPARLRASLGQNFPDAGFRGRAGPTASRRGSSGRRRPFPYLQRVFQCLAFPLPSGWGRCQGPRKAPFPELRSCDCATVPKASARLVNQRVASGKPQGHFVSHRLGT